MKAEIRDLWETGREIIGYVGTDTDRPASVSELKKCENVIFGSRLPYGEYEVMIDNELVVISKGLAKGSYGSFAILEVEHYL